VFLRNKNNSGREFFPAFRLSAGNVPALCYSSAVSSPNPSLKSHSPRHAALVRVTHWLTVLAFFALAISGGEIVISHPRFYLGEVGNVNTKPLFTLPIPSSRETVPTGFGYVMPDQNGWSRALHFEAAWLVVFTGLVYVIWGVFRGHFRRAMLPEQGQRFFPALLQSFAKIFRRAPTGADEAHSYNLLQRIAYLIVIFVLFPLVIWTGLAMSPSFTASFPEAVILLGGRQTARTLHLFVSLALVAFLIVHLAMIALAGFWWRTRAMITGRAAAGNAAQKEEA
jgi:thiosulfate reductase cytochrome b subunit